jgi:hypothetical protein
MLTIEEAKARIGKTVRATMSMGIKGRGELRPGARWIVESVIEGPPPSMQLRHVSPIGEFTFTDQLTHYVTEEAWAQSHR